MYNLWSDDGVGICHVNALFTGNETAYQVAGDVNKDGLVDWNNKKGLYVPETWSIPLIGGLDGDLTNGESLDCVPCEENWEYDESEQKCKREPRLTAIPLSQAAQIAQCTAWGSSYDFGEKMCYKSPECMPSAKMSPGDKEKYVV